MKLIIKHIWKILFLLAGAAGVWIGALFITEAIHYYRHSHQVFGKSLHWGVLSTSEEKNFIYTEYQYTLGPETYTACYVYPKPAYKSKSAALALLEDKKSEVVLVWYSTPNESVLERVFPMNDLIRLIVILCILLYFALLKNYLQNFQSNLVN